MLFSNWSTLLRVLLGGIGVYILLIILLRLSGKRSLSQLNAFDFIVTVAFGSTLASTILNTSIGLADGAAALAVLVLMQFVVAWASIRSTALRRLVKAEPRLLFYRGGYYENNMRRERVTREEILQAVRSQGIASLEQVAAIVLETNGNISVIGKAEGVGLSALENVDPSDTRDR